MTKVSGGAKRQRFFKTCMIKYGDCPYTLFVVHCCAWILALSAGSYMVYSSQSSFAMRQALVQTILDNQVWPDPRMLPLNVPDNPYLENLADTSDFLSWSGGIVWVISLFTLMGICAFLPILACGCCTCDCLPWTYKTYRTQIRKEWNLSDDQVIQFDFNFYDWGHWDYGYGHGDGYGNGAQGAATSAPAPTAATTETIPTTTPTPTPTAYASDPTTTAATMTETYYDNTYMTETNPPTAN